MRSRMRMISTSIVAFIIIYAFINVQQIDIPDYLPAGAHEYFHPGENNGTLPQKNSSEDASHDILDDFLQRPILDYAQAVEYNSKTCPTKGVNYDRHAVDEQRWKGIPSSQIVRWRQNIVTHLRKMQTESKEPPRSGRGIVMAAGDKAAVIRARTNIRLLKSYNCTLHIEIFHFSNELSESDKKFLEDLSALEEGQSADNPLEVKVRVVENIRKGSGWKAFEIKGAAIQQSSFEEILYLDTDSYLLRDPNDLFESKPFQERGLMFWPDYTKSHPTNPLWRLLGQPCRNEYEGESGQILINRTRHQDLLWLVEYFAQQHLTYYGFMGGDRDSFRAAALLLGKSWGGPGRINAAVSPDFRKENPMGGGHTMLQADHEGMWMFVHANLIKHSLFTTPLWSRIHRVTHDSFAKGATYGDIDPPNDSVGDGVKFDVSSTPRMETTVTPFEGYDDGLVTVEDWDDYDYLQGFEDKWNDFGGKQGG